MHLAKVFHDLRSLLVTQSFLGGEVDDISGTIGAKSLQGTPFYKFMKQSVMKPEVILNASRKIGTWKIGNQKIGTGKLAPGKLVTR